MGVISLFFSQFFFTFCSLSLIFLYFFYSKAEIKDSFLTLNLNYLKKLQSIQYLKYCMRPQSEKDIYAGLQMEKLVEATRTG
jgi:hypothetical protein